jgi:quinol monooxygenase YgiN
MITRIVRMHFEASKTEAFIEIFNTSKNAIRNMPGCMYLSLHRDHADANVFYTLSKWDSDADLQNYRNSELFAGTWAATKALFAGKPQAWSLDPITELP